MSTTLEREVITPNLLGKFVEMLLVVEQYCAMFIYFNKENYFGPNSCRGKSKVGLNKNISREVMALHTLGMDSDYNQQDIIELAKGITGWSVKRLKKSIAQVF